MDPFEIWMREILPRLSLTDTLSRLILLPLENPLTAPRLAQAIDGNALYVETVFGELKRKTGRTERPSLEAALVLLGVEQVWLGLLALGKERTARPHLRVGGSRGWPDPRQALRLGESARRAWAEEKDAPNLAWVYRGCMGWDLLYSVAESKNADKKLLEWIDRLFIDALKASRIAWAASRFVRTSAGMGVLSVRRQALALAKVALLGEAMWCVSDPAYAMWSKRLRDQKVPVVARSFLERQNYDGSDRFLFSAVWWNTCGMGDVATTDSLLKLTDGGVLQTGGASEVEVISQCLLLALQVMDNPAGTPPLDPSHSTQAQVQDQWFGPLLSDFDADRVKILQAVRAASIV